MPLPQRNTQPTKRPACADCGKLEKEYGINRQAGGKMD